MRDSKIFYCFVFAVCFTSCHTKAQENKSKNLNKIPEEQHVMLGRFDSYEEGFFTFKFKNEEGDRSVISFSAIEKDVLTKYDLTNNDYQGRKFEITYEVEEKPEMDPEGETIYNRIKTIIVLKLLD